MSAERGQTIFKTEADHGAENAQSATIDIA